MNSEEAKRIVANGLERRRERRREAAMEARLERYELDMIDTCNENCADAKLHRRQEELSRISEEQVRARQAARAAAMAKEQAREDAATAACRYYGVVCLVILWVSAVTRLPFWAAITLIAGLAVFPVAYIFRLYYPIER